MSLERRIKEKIEQEAEKLIIRYHSYHNNLHIEYERNRKRIKDVPPKEIKIPDYWKTDNKHNPFYVYKHSKSIAKSISRKIRTGKYKPNCPYEKQIPKHSGGYRTVAVYQIPDAAVSSLYYEQLLRKNRHRFSGFCYAYRNDRNVHYAIQDISVDISQHARTFISEFDFSDFFGSISHEYLYQQFKKNGFFISEEEKHVIDAFLSLRDRGIPQGTSISLFLANLVCWEMDKKLEKEGLQFARYADDTIIWSQDYNKICKSFDIIYDFSVKAGVPINYTKSDGISLLTKKGLPTELSNIKFSMDFLGYSISVDSVSIKENKVKKIKKQIGYLLYRNLIQPLKGEQLKSITIPSNNKDEAFMSAIMQIRRYLYGNLNEVHIKNYLLGRANRLNFKGLMSFYPLLNNEKQLLELDGWMVSVIHRSLALRAKLLKKWGYDRYNIFPFNVEKPNLVSECKKQEINGKRLLQLPSFFRIYLALRKGLLDQGIEKTMNPSSTMYDY